MASRVSGPNAEKAVLGFVTELLTPWPGWLQEAIDAMRRRLEELAARLPESLQSDERRLGELEKQVENLVDLLADGASESPALRRRPGHLEEEQAQLRARVEEARQTAGAPSRSRTTDGSASRCPSWRASCATTSTRRPGCRVNSSVRSGPRR